MVAVLWFDSDEDALLHRCEAGSSRTGRWKRPGESDSKSGVCVRGDGI
jgi:hypothetical protein